MMSVRAFQYSVLIFIAVVLSWPASAQVKVSASIKPLQLIAAAIMDGTLAPGLVLGGSQDSHTAALRPSGRRMLANAELLIWLGPALEQSLVKVMDELDGDVITVQELSGIKLAYLLLADSHDDAGIHNEGDDHNLEGQQIVDPHLWLDTENARVIARAIEQKLIQLDASNENLYRRNLQSFESAMDALEINIQSDLLPQMDKPFAVYHNALQYFEMQFGLQHLLSFTELEHVNPGIKHLRSVKAQLQSQNIHCLLVEPGINIGELRSILEDEEMRYARIDVMGNDYPVAPGSYAQLIQSLSDTMLECLH